MSDLILNIVDCMAKNQNEMHYYKKNFQLGNVINLDKFRIITVSMYHLTVVGNMVLSCYFAEKFIQCDQDLSGDLSKLQFYFKL